MSGITANPAASAGVTACGRITSIGGHTVTNTSDLHTAMEGFKVGQTVTLTWMDASGAIPQRLGHARAGLLPGLTTTGCVALGLRGPGTRTPVSHRP